MSYIENPKMEGSGIVDCIPQSTPNCPQECEDCFFLSGRSYLEPLKDNLPNIPSWREAGGRVVAVNRGGNDSNNERALVEQVGKRFIERFFNTASPQALDQYPGPVVLTVNPGEMTDTDFHLLDEFPKNLMFVRVRVNAWNINEVVIPAVYHYTDEDVKVVLTYMAYYRKDVPQVGWVDLPPGESFYEWKKRTLNSYWVLTDYVRQLIEQKYIDNPFVYTCGYKGTHDCKSCGNCLREYYRVKEELK